MKRLFFGMLFSAGLLVAGATNASAAVICSDDPVVPIGTPVHLTANATVTTGLLSGTVYAGSTSRTTWFGIVLSN
jgi:hypothetical protein